jgi:tetratricopeptide (TPR) repeat protein
LLIEQAEARGESLEDPLLLLSVLFGVWVANFVAFNGDVLREPAAQFLAIAERQGLSGPLMVGHSMMGNYFAATGDFAQGRAHFDQGIALYDPAACRPLTLFAAQDDRVALLSFRSLTLWMLGYPEAALKDAKHALEDAREIGQAASLMIALYWTSLTETSCRNYAAANALSDQLVALANETGSPAWKVYGMINKGCVSALTGNAAEAIKMITSGLAANPSMGSTLGDPFNLLSLAHAYAELGRCDDAMRCIGEAMTQIEKTNERRFEAEVNRIAGEIKLKSSEHNDAKAQAYFERSLAVARQQITPVPPKKVSHEPTVWTCPSFIAGSLRNTSAC